MNKCRKCKNTLRPTAKFCPRCGGELEGLATYCWSCQAYVDDEPNASKTRAERAAAERDTRLEKEIEHEIDLAMTDAGFHVVRFSQARASQQTPGIPDRLYLLPSSGVALWVEVKRARGKVSPAQKELHELLRASGHEVEVWRHENDAHDFLERGL